MEKVYTFEALTDIWTGDHQGKAGHTIPTGLLGSIRWWFEVLVRGLGGSACDPTAPNDRCPDQNGRRCVVCELFGCTGWGRKFRFEVLNENGEPKDSQIEKGQKFAFRFLELRPICDEEWALLDLTLRLIAEYGAIGGKTVLKPSDDPKHQTARCHRDYGLIRVDEHPQISAKAERELRSYVGLPWWRRVDHDDFAWASLEHFWCVKGRHLARQNNSYSSFNQILGRNMQRNRSQQLYRDTSANRWLAGGQQRSKKVFSFKQPQEARRTFGFVNPGTVDFDEMRRRLKGVWREFQDQEFREGLKDILPDLLNAYTGAAP